MCSYVLFHTAQGSGSWVVERVKEVVSKDDNDPTTHSKIIKGYVPQYLQKHRTTVSREP